MRRLDPLMAHGALHPGDSVHRASEALLVHQQAGTARDTPEDLGVPVAHQARFALLRPHGAQRRQRQDAGGQDPRHSPRPAPRAGLRPHVSKCTSRSPHRAPLTSTACRGWTVLAAWYHRPALATGDSNDYEGLFTKLAGASLARRPGLNDSSWTLEPTPRATLVDCCGGTLR